MENGTFRRSEPSFPADTYCKTRPWKSSWHQEVSYFCQDFPFDRGKRKNICPNYSPSHVTVFCFLIYPFYLLLSSVHHVRIYGPEHRQESGQGAPPGWGRNQIRDPANPKGQPDVRPPALPSFKYDAEVAAEGDLQL